MRPGNSRLFRIASDGLAYELRSHDVRPGQQYILITTLPLDGGTIAQAVSLDCEGVYGTGIRVPEAVSEAESRQLAALGLGQVRMLYVWPAGITPIVWDGEGRAEWLVDDEPCVGIKADHDCGSLRLRLRELQTVECVT